MGFVRSLSLRFRHTGRPYSYGLIHLAATVWYLAIRNATLVYYVFLVFK